jgi:hypothetical protein
MVPSLLSDGAMGDFPSFDVVSMRLTSSTWIPLNTLASTIKEKCFEYPNKGQCTGRNGKNGNMAGAKLLIVVLLVEKTPRNKYS